MDSIKITEIDTLYTIQTSDTEKLSIELEGTSQSRKFFNILDIFNLNLISPKLTDFKLRTRKQDIKGIMGVEKLIQGSQYFLLKNLTLDFCHNLIEDLQPLECLAMVQTLQALDLQLGFNRIRDTSPLNVLTKLERLERISIQLQVNLIENNLSLFCDVGSMVSLTEIEIHVWQNQIKDIQSISMMKPNQNLKRISIDYSKNQLSNLEGLQGLTNMIQLQCLRLRLGSNTIVDFSLIQAINQLTQLQDLELSLAQNKITDLNFLEGYDSLINLQTLLLNFNQNMIIDVNVFSFIGNLNKLNKLSLQFQSNRISSLAVLQCVKNLSNLRVFFLLCDYNRVEEINFIGSFEGLSYLNDVQINLNFNQITDWTPMVCLGGSHKLSLLEIMMAGNKLQFMDPFFKLVYRKIKSLKIDLSDNQISQIENYSQTEKISSVDSLFLRMVQVCSPPVRSNYQTVIDHIVYSVQDVPKINLNFKVVKLER